MTGQYLIHLLFGLSVTSTVLYWLSWKRSDERFLRVARVLFSLVSLLLITSASLLIVEIVRHRFEYTYVYSYSSVNLPLHLLIASFYSGQEGSFLLWAMLVSIIGVALIPYSRKHQYEGQAMTIYGLILSFLTLLLIAKNPFSFYWETFAPQGITMADVPADGRGLNPLLHNAWITIHPPILFTGFAAMSVSFAFAMAGLIKRDYHRWIGIALPWTLFATAILGFGIMLGGFWAYETLGWGGFWGWDPVENSSLIPWLVSVGLVHTMLVQKRTHGLVKTNMALAIGTFVMVLYSTFLTRSGVLGDTSVHSFVDPGKFAFWILLAFMLAFTVLGAVMLIARRNDMNINRKEFTPKSREFMMSIGAALVMASALFVTVGTSWPVFMEIINQPKVAVATDFYNRIHIILVPLILITNGLALLVQWRHTSGNVFVKNVLWSAGISLVLTVGVVMLGIRDVPFIALSACAWFSLIINAQIGFRLMRRSASMAGAYISHLGIAVLMFGIIASSAYTKTYHATLVEGVPQKVGEFTLTFLGREQIEKYYTDREKYRYNVRVEHASENVDVASVLYWSDFNRRESAFLEPGIRWGIVNDLYISPKATDHEQVMNSTAVMRGGTIQNPLDSLMSITLERFTTPVEEGTNADGTMNMGAVLHIADTTMRALTKVSMHGGKPAFEPVWTRLPNSKIEVGLTAIVRNNDDPTKSTGELSFRDTGKPLPKPREIYTVDFSVKPLISLVWIGVITMVAGFVFSIVRYAKLEDRTAV
ncbi:MAG: cytochrome c biogenesis protein CcsA [Ignavibacteria bacterium]|nr:cytochrome c biogenesis protein CcsA [Ignavibacteria bacterium]